MCVLFMVSVGGKRDCLGVLDGRTGFFVKLGFLFWNEKGNTEISMDN